MYNSKITTCTYEYSVTRYLFYTEDIQNEVYRL